MPVIFFIIFFIATLSLPACSFTASFSDNSPITLIANKNSSGSIDVKGWSKTQQLTLMNGGPYVDNHFSSAVPVKFIQRFNRHVVSIDINNDLHIHDFGVKPAKQILQHSLGDEVTALSAHSGDIYIGFKNSGAIKLNRTSDNSIKISKLTSVNSISQIKVINNTVYLLADREKILRYSHADLTTGTRATPQELLLPEKTNDFAITNDTAVLIGPDFGIGVVDLANPNTFVSSLPLQGSKQQISMIG